MQEKFRWALATIHRKEIGQICTTVTKLGLLISFLDRSMYSASSIGTVAERRNSYKKKK